MKLSEEDVRKLRKYAAVPPTRKVHPEDAALYQSGLVDGMALLATEILGQLTSDDVVPEEIKESE